MVNNGQSCIAAKRFIVADAIADEFERRFVAGMEALVVGDPMDRRHRRRSAGDEVAARDHCRPGGAERAGGRPHPHRWPAARPAGLVLRADGAHRHAPANHRPTTRRSSARSPCCSGSRTSTRRSGWPTTTRSGSAPAPGPANDAERARFVARARGRHGVHQRHGGLRSAGAVRRGQGVRIRPRAEPSTASGSSSISRRYGQA